MRLPLRRGIGRLRRESRLGREADEDVDERRTSVGLSQLLSLLRAEDETGGVASEPVLLSLAEGGTAGAAGAAGVTATEDLGVLDEALGSDGDDDDDERRLCIPDCEAGGIGAAAMRMRCRRCAPLGSELEEALVDVGVAGEASAEADAEAGDDGSRRGGLLGDSGVWCSDGVPR